MVICVAEEMESRLEQSCGSSGVVGAVLNAVLLRQDPLWSGGPGLLQLEDRSKEERPKSRQTHEMDLIEPGMKAARPPRIWLDRWWSPDPRKAPREQAPGLAAYYWTGAAPEPHDIRDISATGLYVITEERWYPGTLVLMTLTNTDRGDKCAERSIAVHSRAIRWGNDGVGLQFVLANNQDKSRWPNLVVDGLDRKELDRFLRQLHKGKG
jgi:hypothetical protein